MKQLSYFVALAALLMSASCQKEDIQTESSVKDPVFTATIANDATKTSLNLSTKKVSWTVTDEIKVSDGTKTVAYVVSSIDGEGVATFTKQEGESGILGTGPYTATYGEAPSTSQTYSTEVTNLPMSGTSETSDNTKLTFTVSCGLLKVTLTETGQSIRSVAAGDGTHTYTLTCSEAVSIGSGAAFYIAVPAGTYTDFTFTNSSGIVSTRKNLSIVVEANHIKPVSSTFSPKYTEGEYTGYGTYVSGKWWAPVNCGYDASHTFGLLYQWGRKYGQAYEAGTITPTVISKVNGENEAYKDYFAKYKSKYHYNWFNGIKDELWNGSSKGEFDPCPSGWRVPTYDELNALKDNKSPWTTNKVGGVTQSGYWFSGSEAYSESAPRVFLPAAGRRYYEDGSARERYVGGIYWTSSVKDNNARYLFYLDYTLGMDSAYRSSGHSVRCVQE